MTAGLCLVWFLVPAMAVQIPSGPSDADASHAGRRPPLLLEESRQGNLLVVQIREDLQNSNFPEAIRGLSTLFIEHGHQLVQFEQGRQLSGRLAFEQLAAELPIEVRASLPLHKPDLLQAGDHLWSQGELVAAVRTWNTARCRDLSPELQKQVQVRFLLADLVRGNIRSAKYQLAQFQATYPDAEGRFARQTGPIAELLATEIRQGTDLSQHREIASRLSLVRKLWETDTNAGANHDEHVPQQVTLADDLVIVNDARGVRAFRLQNGEIPWPVHEEDEGWLWEHPAGFRATGAGVVVGHLWIGQAKVHQLRNQMAGAGLIALDLLAEGRLAWQYAAQHTHVDTNGEGESISANLTSPLVTDGARVYISLRTIESVPTAVLCCLNAETGQVIWQRAMGTLISPGKRMPGTVLEDRLLVAGEALVWNLQGEQLVVVDRNDGGLQWSRQLDSQNRWTISNDVLALDQTLFAINSGEVIAVELHHGGLVWQLPLQGMEHLLGFDDDLLIMAGERLCGVRRFDGQLRWNVLPLSSARSTGRGVLSSSVLLWPTQDEVWTVSAWNGDVLQRDGLRSLTKNGGGHLLRTDQHLLIQDADSLRVLETR